MYETVQISTFESDALGNVTLSSVLKKDKNRFFLLLRDKNGNL